MFEDGNYTQILYVKFGSIDGHYLSSQDAATLDDSGATFHQDRWERDPGNPNAGFGITAVLEGGQLLEKAAANVSVIR